MFRLVFVGLFFATVFVQASSLSTPTQAVRSYYEAMNHADIEHLNQVMIKSSFDLTIEVWALSKALKDKNFAKKLKSYGTDPKIDKEVKEAVHLKLLHSTKKTVTAFKETFLGKSRCMVCYKEDGKDKQLYTSLHDKQWKIDYKAGRKVD